MAIDNISKFLIERYSTDFATWLLGEPIVLTTINPTELNVEPIRADSVMLLQSSDVILHTEFQTNVVRDKSFQFALRIVKLYQYLKEEKKEYVLSNRSIPKSSPNRIFGLYQ
jgi:predicted transposase YdaD